jgi:pantoate--beta-alanine ligase
MNVFHTRESLFDVLSKAKANGQSIGFVPTMGALHEGHLALVKRAFSESDIVVVSIFVNPTQFNNPADLEKYPRMLEKDVALLGTVGEVFVFAPNFLEVYPQDDVFEPIDLEGMDTILEGKFRPGHFQGVVHVVRNLFRIVNPDKAFFGMKDFQQLAVIKLMVRKLKMPVTIVECETSRAESGLALSSRNLRLNAEQRKNALIIFQTLERIKEIKKTSTPLETKENAIEFFNHGNLELEYLEIVDSKTLEPLTEKWVSQATCCIAAFCGEVRLIDNMQYK